MVIVTIIPTENPDIYVIDKKTEIEKLNDTIKAIEFDKIVCATEIAERKQKRQRRRGVLSLIWERAVACL